jgi:hypothetical protein
VQFFVVYSIKLSTFIASWLLAAMILLRAVFPAMSNEESLEVRRLIEHFQEHQAQDHSTWWSFLLDHYSPFSSHTSSSEHSTEHSGLPLHCQHLHSASFVALPVSAECITCCSSLSVRLIYPSTTHNLSIVYTSIFQPPKMLIHRTTALSVEI